MALAEDQIAANEDVGKAIVELLVHIGRKHDSPLINIKYLALELLKFTNDNGDSTEVVSAFLDRFLKARLQFNNFFEN